MKREAAFTTKFQRFLHAHPFPGPACFEIKQTTKDAILFSAVKKHQSDALVAAATTGLMHKISDASREYKPFDLVYLRNAKAYVVVKFPQFFCVINIGSWLSEQAYSGRKSLTAERAEEIAQVVVEGRGKTLNIKKKAGL